MSQDYLVDELGQYLTRIISQTNGISLDDTLDLILSSSLMEKQPKIFGLIEEFSGLLQAFQKRRADIEGLLQHPFSLAFYKFFRAFPLPFREEHSHLTGSLSADFIYPRLQERLKSSDGPALLDQIARNYGEEARTINDVTDIERMVRLQENERFDRYLKILILPKLLLISREAHEEAAYHMAREMYHKYNVGYIRLKFTLSRATSDASEQVPGSLHLTSEDIAIGLYTGFMRFKKEQEQAGLSFDFILSPCFRKEPHFFDSTRYSSKREHVDAQIEEILSLLKKFPFLVPHLREVDTVGNERDFYKKSHFQDMQTAFRKLQFYGFKIRSHHGETWRNLRHGIQAVDNAMNIWHIDALEHGLSLGINPNYYFHSLFQRILKENARGIAPKPGSLEYNEISDMLWNHHTSVRDKVLNGEPLNTKDERLFIKAKFHTANEVEHYQHDVLNRMIQKGVSLMSLPSSNFKLTSYFTDYKDHPFSWWEKKGLKLGVGTDNYITLNTDFIKEMLILLYTDPYGLKITKLLMVTTGEYRRPYIAHLLYEMSRKTNQ